MSSKYYYLISFLLVAIFTSSLLYKLGEVPAGIFCDEASRGIEAAIMLETGRDSRGELLPAFFKVFGNAIGGGIFYTNLLPLLFLDLSPLSVRLAAVFWAIIGSIFFIKLSKKLFTPLEAICSVIFLFTSFWFWQNSRIGFEFISLPALLLGSLTFGIRPTKAGPIVSSILLAISFYTYLPSFIVSPCIFLFLVTYWKLSEKLSAKRILLAVGVFIVFSAPAIYHTIWGDVFTRWTQVDDDNKFTIQFIYSLVDKYFGHFSLRFLVIQGDFFGRNFVEGFGIVSKWLLPFLFLGIIKGILDIYHKKEVSRGALILFLLFVIYPLPGMLTVDGASFTRSISGIIGICLTASLGVSLIVSWGKRLGSVIVISLLLLLAVDVGRFLKVYFSTFAVTSAQKSDGWQFGVKEIVAASIPYAKKGYQIYVTSNDFNQLDSLLDFYLFRNPLRSQFQVCNFDCYTLEKPIIAVIRANNFFPFLGVERDVIHYPSGEIAFHLVELRRALPINWTWKVSPILPREFNISAQKEISELIEHPKENFFNNPFGVNLLGYQTGCIIAESSIESDQGREESFYGIADDTLTLWINDQIAVDIPTFNDFKIVEGKALLKVGKNKVRVKHCNDSGASFFSIFFDPKLFRFAN